MRAGFKSLPTVAWLGPEGPVKLVSPLNYITESGREIEVPAGLQSDLESRPTWLPGVVQWILGDKLTTALAALLHDYLYRSGPTLQPPIDRREADSLYYEALRSIGHSPISAGVAWLGLRVGGSSAWNSHRSS